VHGRNFNAFAAIGTEDGAKNNNTGLKIVAFPSVGVFQNSKPEVLLACFYSYL
jgi:hypothetical protein